MSETNKNTEILIRDNVLIRSIFTGSLTETKILLLALYSVQRTGNLTLRFASKELVQKLHVSDDPALYPLLKKTAKRLLQKFVIVEKRGTKNRSTFEGFALVPYCSYIDGVFTIEISKHALQFLTDLKTPYTATDMSVLMSFGTGGEKVRSRSFPLRLYELLKTKKYLLSSEREYVSEIIPLSELKIRGGLVDIMKDMELEPLQEIDLGNDVMESYAKGTYDSWFNFRRRVLDPAVSEINMKTDIFISYSVITVGQAGRVEAVEFYIKENDAVKSLTDTGGDNGIAIKNDVVITTEEHSTPSSKPAEIEMIRSFITENISDEDVGRIIDAAEGDIEKVRAAYGLAEIQTGKIRDLASWMVSAIKGGWAENTSSAAAGTRTGNFSGRKSFSRMDHEGRFGFGANDYDFDVLEEELLARGYEQCGGYEKHGDGA